MKKSAIKSRITILLVSSSVFTLFGLVENYTDWLFIPIKCYEINSKTNTLKETKESKDFCIEHVYLPYQRKQGSVKLGIRTKLNGEKYLYTTTTFWIADKIGAEKFSDVEGDFTTDVMKIYNSSGLVKFNKLDIGLPNETAPYPTNEYRAYCDRRPIFLNDLFMDHKCLDKQKLVWRKIQEISPNSFNNYLIPFSKLIFRWVSSNPFKILGGVFFLIAFTRLYPLLNFSKNSSEDTKVSSSISIEENIKKSSKKILELTVLIAVLGGLGYILNNTVYLIPADLLCLNEQDDGKGRINSGGSSEIENICINEILVPFNSFRGQIELGMIISYKDGAAIVTETTMFVSEDGSFQDASGDMMHTKISYFNQFGVLVKRDSELIGEQLANLMPDKVNVEIWKLVKNKLTSNNEIIYVSVQRILGEVVEDSLPFMFAAYALLYSYLLYLNLNFGKESPKNLD